MEALGEQADPAVAVERHADGRLRDRAVELADELGALVLARDDLAGTAPLALDLREEPGVACLVGMRRSDGADRGGDGEGGQGQAVAHGAHSCCQHCAAIITGNG